MPDSPNAQADFYRSETVGTFRIGKEFSDCHLNWGFPAGQLTVKNNDIRRDIQYSFDGVHIAFPLVKGTDANVGGQWYDYLEQHQTEVFLRIAPEEYVVGDEDLDIRFKVGVFRSTASR